MTEEEMESIRSRSSCTSSIRNHVVGTGHEFRLVNILTNSYQK